jgi:transposase-like protein
MPSERLRTEREWRPASTDGTPKRHWTDAEKVAMVRECDAPGSSVSVVSRRYDLNSNILFNWRNQVRRGVLGHGKAARPVPDFVPVTIIDDPTVRRALPAPQTAKRQKKLTRRSLAKIAATAPKPESGRIEIKLPNGVCMRFDSSVDDGMLCRVLAVLMVQS